VPPCFVTDFLLLGATKKSMRCSRAFQTSHNKPVYASPPPIEARGGSLGGRLDPGAAPPVAAVQTGAN
jgi:hypothetical protein